LEYLDFDVIVGPGEGRGYPVTVVRSPAGEAQGSLRLPFDALELERRLQAVQVALLRSGEGDRRVLASEAMGVRDFGRALFDALLVGEVRSRYDVSRREALAQGAGLRIKLRLRPPELAALPWEFMYDARQGEYVCLSRHTPIVRYLDLARPIRPMRVTPPLRVLGMAVGPRDRAPLNLEAAKCRVETALAGVARLTWLEGGTWRDVQRMLRRGPWHVFHFIGHGGFDRAADEGYIAVADAHGDAWHLGATQLGRLLADHRPLRLALLSACEGARGSERDVFSSTASILVRRGVPAVLAMQVAVTDRAAVEFSRTFYEALADGVPVDAATAEARQAISIAAPHSVAWGAPVLYMRTPDGALFDVNPGAPRTPDGALFDVARDRAAPSASPRPTLIALYRQIVERLDAEAVQTLCFYVGVDYDDLSGEGRAGKVRELLEALRRQERVPELVQAARDLHPDLAWGADAPPPTEAPQSPRRPPPDPRGADPLDRREDFEPEMVRIPAGAFVIGSDPAEDPAALQVEQPQHTLHLPAYALARTPVTNAQYAAFVAATDRHPPAHWTQERPPADLAQHPVVNVSWYDALAYCRWLSEVTGAPYGLPSEAQWEKAARGSDGRRYPWGDRWDARLCNTRESRHQGTTPVHAHPLGASPYRLLDMAGNVWEWTCTLWGMRGAVPMFRYPYDPEDGREDPHADDEIRRVLRGGSFNYEHTSSRCASRNRLAPDSVSWYVGFRVAMALEEARA
jgi:formylglycine-generating enzyme required for sulfatase activity